MHYLTQEIVLNFQSLSNYLTKSANREKDFSLYVDLAKLSNGEDVNGISRRLVDELLDFKIMN